jgi:TPP-dependent pyruvate/acetoin dehydrogenase alpha subunit
MIDTTLLEEYQKKYKVPRTQELLNNNNLTASTLTKMLKSMLKIRYTEERIAQRVLEKKIDTPCHLYIGQEAVAVGTCTALKISDYVFSTHRSHGHYLAKGGGIRELFAEIYCRETGCSGGRGGSMHLCDPSRGLLGSSSIVAGGLGIGIGPALGSKIMKSGDISVIFHGDCVPEEGIWHESLNFSAVNKLPVIYICENNLYAASLPLEERRLRDNIPEIAKGHGLPVTIIDGNDVLKVYDETLKAAERARSNEGPQFIECRTYRWLGHVGPNDDIDKGLRSKEELDYWKERCPIAAFSKYLINKEIITKKEWKILQEEIQDIIDKAETFALESNYPNPETLLKNVYKVSEVTE